MQTFNQALANSSGRTTRSTPQPLAPRQEQMLLALWKRMTQLYGHKWSSQHPLMDGAEYSEDFRLWAKKTAHLSDSAWARGMEAVEHRNKTAAQNGQLDTWPPNYAEFVGMSEPAPGSAAHRPFEKLALPDKSEQERAHKAGEEVLGALKGLWNE